MRLFEKAGREFFKNAGGVVTVAKGGTDLKTFSLNIDLKSCTHASKVSLTRTRFNNMCMRSVLEKQLVAEQNTRATKTCGFEFTAQEK